VLRHHLVRSLLLTWFVTLSSVFADDQLPKYHVLIIGNRPASTIESQSGKKIFPGTFQQIMDFKHDPQDTLKTKRLDLIKKRILELGLSTEPFTVEFTEDASGYTHGGIIIRARGQSEVLQVDDAPQLKDPEEKEDLEYANTIGLEHIEASLQQSTSLPTARRQLIRWTLGPSPANRTCVQTGSHHDFEDPRVRRVFEGAQLNERADFSSQEIQDALSDAARYLNRSQRLRIFEINPCLKSIQKGLWSHLVREKRGQLAWDFKRWVEVVDANKNKFTFFGKTESHVFREDAGDVMMMLRFSQQVLLDLKPNEFSLWLPREFREWATRDTNTPDVATRMEPIDFLAFFVASNHFADLIKTSNHDPVSRNHVVKTAIQHALSPEIYPPVISAAKINSNDAQTNGKGSFFLYCSGDSFRDSQETSPLVDVRLLTETQLRSWKESAFTYTFLCGSLGANLVVPVEKIVLPLKDPIDALFQVGKDRKVKSVVTFNIVDDVGSSYLKQLKGGTILQGYHPAGADEVIEDVRKDFMTEMLDSDFYFPVNFQTSEAQLLIGGVRNLKMRFEKEVAGITSQIIFYIPHGGDVSKQGVSDDDLGNLFRERRKLSETRRLHILNLACHSVKHLHSWVHFFQVSLKGEWDVDQIKQQLSTLESEVPITIGSDTAFSTNDVNLLINYSRYPFKAIELAIEEKPVQELIAFLTNQEFIPDSNLGKNYLYDIPAQSNRLNLSIETSAGGRLLY
jgi:hypothetical protein